MINYAKHEEEFHGIFKLINQEEILAKAVLTEDNGETLAFLQDPVVIQIINKDLGEGKMMRGMGFHKWMQLSDEEFFIIREKDIIAVASMNKEVVLMYESFLAQGDPNETEEQRIQRNSRRRVNIKDAKGYVGKVDEYRKRLEETYKRSQPIDDP